MKTINVGTHTVKLYDSIDELPIKRFHKFNKYMLIDSGIGSDINDIITHIDKVSKFIDSDVKSAKLELENMKQSLYLMMSEVNVKNLSFAILVYSIDGAVVYNISDDNIKMIMHKLSDIKVGFITKIIDSIKKKLMMS